MIGGADGKRRHAKREQIGQCRQPRAEVEVLEPRRAGVPAIFGAGLDEMKARRVGDAGQGAKDDGLDPGEDRRVDADADA